MHGLSKTHREIYSRELVHAMQTLDYIGLKNVKQSHN